MAGREEQLTSLALCWRMERKDGAGFALTSHDRAFERDGCRFDPEPGLVPAAVTRSLGMDAGSAEVSGSVTSAAIGSADLLAGRWDGARARMSMVDWEDPEAEPIELIGGELGDVSIAGHAFSAELIGAAANLDDEVCPTTSPECRAELGDRDCRVDLAGRSRRVTVVTASGNELTLSEALGDAFILGRLRYLGGGNCAAATAILAVDGVKIRVRDVPRMTIEPGCAVSVREGCDKRLATCAARFANAANFRGEPHLPGTDFLTRYPGA